MAEQPELMQKIVALCKRRGFVFPGSEIYGGVANTWDFGPYGLALRQNIKNLWWREFVEKEDRIYGIDGGIILSPKVWEASGHVENFVDPLIECKTCHHRFRIDQIPEFENRGDYYRIKDSSIPCPSGLGHELEFDIWQALPQGVREVKPKKFNGMFRTIIGATEEGMQVYLRPETAQAIFVNFKNIMDTFHPTLPFGIAQIGKAFRNEITAGNFIFRDIEFEQMELEYFVRQEEWEEKYNYWLAKIHSFASLLGFSKSKVHEREHSSEERSHYSQKTIDLEFDFPFGRKELWGLAYRTDYDLKNHSEKSGADLTYSDESGKKFYPHVIEPSLGVDRSMMAVLTQAYAEEGDRVVLKFPARLAPVKVAVFPLVRNKPELTEKAQKVYRDLKQKYSVIFDDRGNIGKRYYSQDEIGTPWCVTVDYQTLEDDTVTVRDRDSAKQERIKTSYLVEYINGKLNE